MRREQLGIGEGELARRIGLEPSMYQDVEYRDAELECVTPLKNVRVLASILGFELGMLFGTGVPTSEERARMRPRNVVLVDARQELGVSIERMAEDVGFYDVFIRDIERDGAALDEYPYEVLRMVADYLKVDPKLLLYAPSE